MKKRNLYFDNLKGLLILLVIIGNSLEFTEPHGINLHYFILVLYLFHMPLFAFISGYFSKKSSKNTMQLVKRTASIYLFFQVFYILLDKLMYRDSELNIQIFYPQWTLWYLITLTFFYILRDYIKSHKKWLIITLFLSLFIGYDTSVGSHISLSRTFFFLPFFVLGESFNLEYIKKLKKYIIFIIALCILSLAILFKIRHEINVEMLFEYAYYEYFFDNRLLSLYLRIFHYVSALSIGSLIMCFMTDKKTLLSYIGKNSLIFYLAHSGVTKILVKISILNYDNILNIILSELLIIFATFIVCILYRQLIQLINDKRA